MRAARARVAMAVAAAGALACVSAGHHVRRLEGRSAPRQERCEHPPVHTDRGPDRPRVVLGVVTAECGSGSEPECRRELERGTCELDADALVEVSNRVTNRVRRMVGTAVEYREDAPAGGPASGVEASP